MTKRLVPPSFYPDEADPCDMMLPQKALEKRLEFQLTTDWDLNGFNFTTWLFQDKSGIRDIHFEVNTTKRELQRIFGRAETPEAETGFHSEEKATQWFLEHPGLQVLQIFSERMPCREKCRSTLRTHFSGVPWYYYYNKEDWKSSRNGKPLKCPAEVLRYKYGL